LKNLNIQCSFVGDVCRVQAKDGRAEDRTRSFVELGTYMIKI
jgi:hypothetical protein